MLPKPTILTRKYLWAAAFRLGVFLLVLLLYLQDRTVLDFTASPVPSLPLWILWAAVLFSMAARGGAAGCSSRFPPCSVGWVLIPFV